MSVKTLKKSRKSAPSRKSKTKKCKSAAVCCGKCSKYHEGTCSIDGKGVEKNDVCKSFSDETTEVCQRCHRKVSYKSMDEYYNSLIRFSMESGSGSSSGQNVHLCRKCESEVFDMFQDFLERVKEFPSGKEELEKAK